MSLSNFSSCAAAKAWAQRYQPASARDLKREWRAGLAILATMLLGEVVLALLGRELPAHGWARSWCYLGFALGALFLIRFLLLGMQEHELRYVPANLYALEELAAIRELPEVGDVLARIARQGRPINQHEANCLFDLASWITSEQKRARLEVQLLGSAPSASKAPCSLDLA